LLLSSFDSLKFGATLLKARKELGLKQSQVAKLAGLSRLQIVRAERGRSLPRFDEAVRLAGALKLSLAELAYVRPRPSNHLRGIAVELYRMGLCDLEVAGAETPGSLRRAEEVVVLALRGDRPEPRVVEALPFVLARQRLRVSLLDAFVKLHDPRTGPRLGWLCEITLTLARRAGFPVELRDQRRLETLSKKWKRAEEPDGLGHPADSNLPPLWKRRNMTYAGKLEDFMARTVEAAAAFRAFGPDGEGGG
jgi:transcriptional regulator with XRE-family HTH domain